MDYINIFIRITKESMSFQVVQIEKKYYQKSQESYMGYFGIW